MSAAIPNGYVFIARDILKSTLWQRRPEDRVVALTSVVLANHQPAVWHDGFRDIPLARGQFIRSWDGLAKKCNLTNKSVRTSIKRLADSNFIARKSTAFYSVFTVPNYGKYQDRDRYGREKEMPGGAILVARRILESSLWKMSAQDRVVGISCLLIASHTAGSMKLGAESIHLDRGQFHASWDHLARACRLTVEETQESIARLITSGFIVRDRLTPSVFTILNYNHYQDPIKYSEGEAQSSLDSTQGRLFEVPESPAPDRATPGQPPGKGRARVGQPSGKGRATDKNSNNSKEWEEGGKTSPPPELFKNEYPGASPPSPPPESLTIARAYDSRFPRIMALRKAIHQASLYLGRGGKLEEALKAIAEEQRPDLVIWKILDPILENKKSDWSGFVPPKEWLNAESQ